MLRLVESNESTHFSTSATIDTNLETELVDLVCSSLDPIRKASKVRFQAMRIRIPSIFLRPTIVNIHIFVAGILLKH